MTGNETACKMGVSRCFVKSPSTQLPLTNESEKTHSNRHCWHFCWVLLLAQFDSENPHMVASSVGAFHSAGIRRWGYRRVHAPVPAPMVAPRNVAPAGEDDSRGFAPAVTRLLMLR